MAMADHHTVHSFRFPINAFPAGDQGNEIEQTTIAYRFRKYPSVPFPFCLKLIKAGVCGKHANESSKKSIPDEADIGCITLSYGILELLDIIRGKLPILLLQL